MLNPLFKVPFPRTVEAGFVPILDAPGGLYDFNGEEFR